jgi:hypothetical protein
VSRRIAVTVGVGLVSAAGAATPHAGVARPMSLIGKLGIGGVATTTPVAEPGSYAGANRQNGNPITLFVTANRKSVLNISIPVVTIACTPPGRFPRYDRLGILKAAVEPGGSFVAKGSQTGVFAGTRARFTYSFRGRFQRATASRAATAAGQFREDIVFTDSTTHRCTSDNRSWSVTRTSDPPPGNRREVHVFLHRILPGSDRRRRRNCVRPVPGGHRLLRLENSHVHVEHAILDRDSSPAVRGRADARLAASSGPAGSTGPALQSSGLPR